MATLDAFADDARADEAGGVTDAGPGIDWRHGPALPADAPATVPDLIADCLRRFPDAPVLRDAGRVATWRDLDAWSARLAAAWAGRLPRGERVAILVHNGIPHLIAELACWRLGALAAPIFQGFGTERITALLARLAPRFALVDDPRFVHLLATDVQPFSSADLWRVVEREAGTRLGERPVVASDPCLVQFTSGSTGTPRGVVLTHGNLASQQAAFARHWPEVGPGDRLAAYLPWHHSFGGLAERLWSLCRGADLTVVPGGGRDRQRLIATIREISPTVFLSVPKIHALVKEERLLARGVRWVFTAGAPMPDDLRGWYARQGIPVCEGWGLTETSPSCTLTIPGAGRGGVVGWPIAGVSVGVRRADGRILVRGPNVMAGYFRQETTTLCDGVLDTGDLGMWGDDGLCLRGRADHQLKLGNGEKVCAAELEAALLAHPAIHHAVVGAEPDLIAIVEMHEGHTLAGVLAAVDAVNAQQAVPYQRISGLYVATQRMSVENGQLTPSLKVSRGQVLAAFRRWRSEGGTAFRHQA